MTKIAPSILSADFANMADAVREVELGGADYLHCDVMDGVFVPNLTFGFKMIEDIKPHTSLPLDVHLMIVEPERYVDRFAAAGADIITFHVEATRHVQRVVCAIKDKGVRAGVVLNPATPLEMAEYVLMDVDMVLLMSVNPGYGGQSFVPQVGEKIKRLRRMIDEGGYNVELEVDGGVHAGNAAKIAGMGADVLVAGSAVFGGDVRAAIQALRGSGV